MGHVIWCYGAGVRYSVSPPLPELDCGVFHEDNGDLWDDFLKSVKSIGMSV